LYAETNKTPPLYEISARWGFLGRPATPLQTVTDFARRVFVCIKVSYNIPDQLSSFIFS